MVDDLKKWVKGLLLIPWEVAVSLAAPLIGLPIIMYELWVEGRRRH